MGLDVILLHKTERAQVADPSCSFRVDEDRLPPRPNEIFPLAEGLRAMAGYQSGVLRAAAQPIDRLIYRPARAGLAATVTIEWDTRDAPRIDEHDWRLAFEVQSKQFRAVLGRAQQSLQACYHLPPALRAILHAIRHCSGQGELRRLYLAAKCNELFCETLRYRRDGDLLETHQNTSLSEGDTRRLTAARRYVEEHATERPTLEQVARICGLSRPKLTSGFRTLFGCTVGDTMADARFAKATDLLLATDGNIDSIAFTVGFENAAAFSRAFCRRFGIGPSHYRASGGLAPLGPQAPRSFSY